MMNTGNAEIEYETYEDIATRQRARQIMLLEGIRTSLVLLVSALGFLLLLGVASVLISLS